MPTHCLYTELPLDQCAHCREAEEREAAQAVPTTPQFRRGAPQPPARPAPTRGFPARYEGTCFACGDDILVGERILSTADDRYIHEECL